MKIANSGKVIELFALLSPLSLAGEGRFFSRADRGPPIRGGFCAYASR
jgi:hypothetical protein